MHLSKSNWFSWNNSYSKTEKNQAPMYCTDVLPCVTQKCFACFQGAALVRHSGKYTMYIVNIKSISLAWWPSLRGKKIFSYFGMKMSPHSWIIKLRRDGFLCCETNLSKSKASFRCNIIGRISHQLSTLKICLAWWPNDLIQMQKFSDWFSLPWRGAHFP